MKCLSDQLERNFSKFRSLCVDRLRQVGDFNLNDRSDIVRWSDSVGLYMPDEHQITYF